MKQKLVLVVEGVLRIGIAAIFVYASWDKIQDPALFADAVQSYRILPPFVAGIVALVLPFVELLAGLVLVFTKWTREAALLILGMLGIFLVGLTQAWLRGLEIDCGCFGASDGTPPPLWVDILRDLAILCPTIWLAFRPGRWIWART
ncbi:MAG: DoxX family membrane protein [Kiritimatiellae bacterium]|nr:DoxX family membrane protein [Kiritimatiellia bacterium]